MGIPDLAPLDRGQHFRLNAVGVGVCPTKIRLLTGDEARDLSVGDARWLAHMLLRAALTIDGEARR